MEETHQCDVFVDLYLRMNDALLSLVLFQDENCMPEDSGYEQVPWMTRGHVQRTVADIDVLLVVLDRNHASPKLVPWVWISVSFV